MKLLVEIPEKTYIHLCNGGNIGASLLIENAIKNGQPLPEDCEVLTKEAYEDLCKRASKGVGNGNND